MQHYAIFLRGFNFDIKYRRSEQNGNADCLSRLPLSTKDEFYDVVDVYFIEALETLSIDVFDMRKYVKEDTIIQKIISALVRGEVLNARDTWNIDPSEFAVENNLLVRGPRIVVPKKLRERVLVELHAGHFGIVKMKGLARSYCWWPGIDRDIESLASSCESCLLSRNNPPKVAKHAWEPATAPFERIHIDFAGPYLGFIFFFGN